MTMMLVDPDIVIPNKSLELETQRLLEEHPWAFEFDPRQNFKKIKIWE